MPTTRLLKWVNAGRITMSGMQTLCTRVRCVFFFMGESKLRYQQLYLFKTANFYWFYDFAMYPSVIQK